MDGNVAAMSLQERGAYITLLCICWQEKSLPRELGKLANIVGLPVPLFRKLWPSLRRCFRTHGTRLIHPRLEKERVKQANFREKQVNAGRASGVARRQPKANETPTGSEPNMNQTATTVQPH